MAVSADIVADEVIFKRAHSHDPERIKTQVKRVSLDVFETTASELGGKAVVTVEQSCSRLKLMIMKQLLNCTRKCS